MSVGILKEWVIRDTIRSVAITRKIHDSYSISTLSLMTREKVFAREIARSVEVMDVIRDILKFLSCFQFNFWNWQNFFSIFSTLLSIKGDSSKFGLNSSGKNSYFVN